jgi:hypothetical protein
MASGNDARLGLSKETTYGTRVAPARFFPFTGESLNYEYEKYASRALGVGRWTRPTVRTKSAGSGAISGEVPTTGFGFLLDALHNNAVTPVQQGATAAYLQTHTLDTAPAKSYSVQVQTPPVTSSTLVPHDLLGVMFSGIELSWDDVLTFSMPASVQALSIAESLATYVAPTAWSLLTFRGGSISIGGVAQTNSIIGAGSLNIGFNLRTGVHYLGSGGLMAKPVEMDKPSASGTCTADFNDNTHLSRTIDDTIADVVLRFEGSVIAGSDEYALEVTIPDCEFTSPRPTVDGPGPVAQPIAFSNASTTGDPVVITYCSTDTVI